MVNVLRLARKVTVTLFVTHKRKPRYDIFLYLIYLNCLLVLLLISYYIKVKLLWHHAVSIRCFHDYATKKHCDLKVTINASLMEIWKSDLCNQGTLHIKMHQVHLRWIHNQIYKMHLLRVWCPRASSEVTLVMYQDSILLYLAKGKQNNRKELWLSTTVFFFFFFSSVIKILIPWSICWNKLWFLVTISAGLVI